VTEAERYYELIRKIQEPKGYFFNNDRNLVMGIINDLLLNKVRYGYMACPCRLVSGERDQDRDILCPCLYRERDVKEFGSCYCNLYVSQEWNDGKIPHSYVPERRPPGK